MAECNGKGTRMTKGGAEKPGQGYPLTSESAIKVRRGIVVMICMARACPAMAVTARGSPTEWPHRRRVRSSGSRGSHPALGISMGMCADVCSMNARGPPARLADTG